MLDRLDGAIAGRRRASFRYHAVEGAASERTVRPLGLYFWGKVWTLVAWCELRSDFRHFRVDRIEALATDGEPFAPERGRTLRDFLEAVAHREPSEAAGSPSPCALITVANRGRLA